MEVVYVVIGIMIGFAVSSIIRRKHPVGFLRIDKSDPDGPYLFLELKKSVNEIIAQRTVLSVRRSEIVSSMKLIQISGIEPESIVDGEGIRYVIFTQGCPHHCPGCHNPQTHPFGGGKLVSIEDILDDISKRKNWIDGITISGGEPFCQIYQCALIAEKAHQMGLSVWCYTGYLFEDLYRQGIELLKHIDVLVDGPFVQAEKSLDLDFRGSRNQRVIDIPESLKEGVAILKQT